VVTVVGAVVAPGSMMKIGCLNVVVVSKGVVTVVGAVVAPGSMMKIGCFCVVVVVGKTYGNVVVVLLVAVVCWKIKSGNSGFLVVDVVEGSVIVGITSFFVVVVTGSVKVGNTREHVVVVTPIYTTVVSVGI
jgi:hypothetical protein